MGNEASKVTPTAYVLFSEMRGGDVQICPPLRSPLGANVNRENQMQWESYLHKIRKAIFLLKKIRQKIETTKKQEMKK